MKTPSEQLVLASKLKDLADQYDQLVGDLNVTEDKEPLLEGIQEVLNEMNKLRDDYMM